VLAVGLGIWMVTLSKNVMAATYAGTAELGAQYALEIGKEWSFEAFDKRTDSRLWFRTTKDDARKMIAAMGKKYGPVKEVKSSKATYAGTQGSSSGDLLASVDVLVVCEREPEVIIRLMLCHSKGDWKLCGFDAFKAP